MNTKQKILMCIFVIAFLISIILFTVYLAYSIKESNEKDDIFGGSLDFFFLSVLTSPFFLSEILLTVFAYKYFGGNYSKLTKILFVASIILLTIVFSCYVLTSWAVFLSFPYHLSYEILLPCSVVLVGASLLTFFVGTVYQRLKSKKYIK